MNRSTTHMRGFSLIEVLLATVILMLFVIGAMQVFAGGQDLVNDSRVRTRARTEHRRNLSALVNSLRESDLREIQGFNKDGVATQPVIKRVTGADLISRTHGDPETIQWMPKNTTVLGIDRPGAVYAVTAGGTQRLLADKVPAGGFRCEMQGSAVLVELTTYYYTREGRTITTTGPALVNIRNTE